MDLDLSVRDIVQKNLSGSLCPSGVRVHPTVGFTSKFLGLWSGRLKSVEDRGIWVGLDPRDEGPGVPPSTEISVSPSWPQPGSGRVRVCRLELSLPVQDGSFFPPAPAPLAQTLDSW